jgi:hypothetical protein
LAEAEKRRPVHTGEKSLHDGTRDKIEVRKARERLRAE